MTKAELARRLAWRFKLIQQAGEHSRNVARTCRHFGISRQAFYRWKRRFDAHGAAGLADRSSAPRRCRRPRRRRSSARFCTSGVLGICRTEFSLPMLPSAIAHPTGSLCRQCELAPEPA
jgi:transposase-like protein